MTDDPQEPPAAAAGWYPQPDGTRRYWDGQAWANAEPEPTGRKQVRFARARGAWEGWPDWLRVAIALGCVVAVLAIGSLAWNAVSAHRVESDARTECEEYVKDSLKSPASAEFSDTESEKKGDTGFIVTGAVDSENGFGAMMRNQYECQVNQVGDGWWLIDLQFEDD